jgi:hypothetical protein
MRGIQLIKIYQLKIGSASTAKARRIPKETKRPLFSTCAGKGDMLPSKRPPWEAR